MTDKCHFVAPSCKLRLFRSSALLRFQDRAECGNMAWTLLELRFVMWSIFLLMQQVGGNVEEAKDHCIELVGCG